MSKLQELYEAIHKLKELGIDLPTKLILDTNRLEEEIIKNEIIPKLANSIDPIINQIQREITLVVEYVPGKDLEVKLTRKRSITIPEEYEHKISGEFGDRPRERKYSFSKPNKSKRTNLRITFEDGTVIFREAASQALIDVILKIGIEKVRDLRLTHNGVPLVDNKLNGFYQQHQVRPGIYIITHSSTLTKRDLILEIAERTNTALEVEIV